MYDSRNHTNLGEKIVTVVTFLVLALVLFGIFYAYRVIEAAFF
jgi:hypothetical protein